MSNILLVTSSPRGTASVSGKLARELAAGLREQLGATLTERDLGANPLPQLDEVLLGGWFTPEDQRTPEQQAAVDRSDALVAELKAADTVVVGAGMINFSVTSNLKAWIDHITRAGVTFRYTEAGTPEGLLIGKKAYLVTSKGGIYSGGAGDFLQPYIKTILSFIGITNVHEITAEGLALGPDVAEKSVANASARVAEVVAAAARAA